MAEDAPLEQYVTAEELRAIGSTTEGKLLLGALGTYFAVRFASAPGERLPPQDPSGEPSKDDGNTD